MDERDYKAMNDELKSTEELMSYEESRKYLISEGLDPDQIAKEGMVFIKTVKENIDLKKQLEYKDKLNKGLAQTANFYRDQIKEKEEEIEKLKSSLFTSERFRIEDAASSIDDRNILHAKYMECVKQLTKSNEMFSEIDELLSYLEDFTHGKDGNRITQMRAKITEYQNSKK